MHAQHLVPTAVGAATVSGLAPLDTILLLMPTRVVKEKVRRGEMGSRPVTEVFGRVFVLTGIFIKGGY